MGPMPIPTEMLRCGRLLSAVLLATAMIALCCTSASADPSPGMTQDTGEWLAQPEVEESTAPVPETPAPATEEAAPDQAAQTNDPVDLTESAAVFGRHTGTMYRPRGVWPQAQSAPTTD